MNKQQQSRFSKPLPDLPILHWEQPTVLSVVFWVVVFAVAYIIAWQVSARLETIPGFVSWFLPGGLRFCALVVLSPRRWWRVWVGEQLAIATFTELDYDYQTLTQQIVDSALPWVCAAVPIFLLIHWRKAQEEITVSLSFVTRTAVAALIGSSLNATLLTTSFVVNELIPSTSVAEIWPAFVLGDFVGISLVGCVAAIAIGATSPVTRGDWRWRFALVPFIATGLELWAPSLFSAQAYFTKLMFLLPMVYMALRYGLWGVALALASVNAMIVTGQLIDNPWGNMREDQFYLLATVFGGISLGAATDEQAYVYAKLERQNERLLDLIEQLNAINADYERLANRLMNAEERERGRISRELHDGLGQVLSAARIRLAAAQSMEAGSAERGDVIGEVATIIEGAYETAREIMEQLAPAALRHGGFEAALVSSDIALFLKNAGIAYELEVNCALNDLNETTGLNLLRIVQECANNTVKHGRASRFTVRLTRDDGTLSLSVADDGVGFDVNSNADGMGLRNIRDRIAALGGVYELSVNPVEDGVVVHGTTHRCLIPSANLGSPQPSANQEVPFLRLA